MEDFKGGAYKITHCETGSFYFGCTNNFITRERDHRYHLRLGDHSNATLQKLYNGNQEIEVEVYPTTDRMEAGALEDLLILENKGNQLMVNQILAGYVPPSANSDWVERMRIQHTGREVSKETRDKMSIASKIRGVSEHCRNKANEVCRRQVTVNGIIYGSLTEAGEAHGITKSGVLGRLKSTSEKFKDWNYVEK